MVSLLLSLALASAAPALSGQTPRDGQPQGGGSGAPARAQAPAKPASGPQRAQPLLPPTLIRSELPTASASIARMHVSHAYDGEAGENLIGVEAEAIRQFVADASIPSSEKSLLLVRYEIGDDEVVEAVLAAAKAGFKEIILVTDLNVSMEADFAAGQESTADFAHARFQKNDMGRAMEAFRQAGFEFGRGAYRIVSQPIYRKVEDNPIPIMHEKELVLFSGERARARIHAAFYGTSNMHGRERYNRLFELALAEPHTARAILDHAQALENAYRDGKPTESVEAFAPVRVAYGDGSFLEVAFTDGKHNPNDRATELFRRAVKEPEQLKIKEVLFSEFVGTYGSQFAALREAMTALPDFKVRGVFDQGFFTTDGFGFPAAMQGFVVARPLGPELMPWDAALRPRLELYGYQRLIDGIEAIDPNEAAPYFVHLWHDKTMLVDVEELDAATGKLQPWTYVLTGSFNDSARFQNAEIQVMYRLPTADPLVERIKRSVLGAVEKEPAYALPLEIAVLRETLSRLVGQSVYDVPPQLARDLKGALEESDVTRALAVLTEAATLKSRLKGERDLDKIRDRIRRVENIARWKAARTKDPREQAVARFERLMNLVASPPKPGALQAALAFIFGPELAGDAMKTLFGEPATDAGRDPASAPSAAPASPSTGAPACADPLRGNPAAPTPEAKPAT